VNPALQRRVVYQQAPMFSQGGKVQNVNINYMYQMLDYEAAYRCDVERVENANKLAIRPSDILPREEEFMAVSTPYKKLREIMLSRKFVALYSEVIGLDENDFKRVEKNFEKELTRRRQVRNPEPLNTKGVGETFEEKSLIKMIKGPFFKFSSRAGVTQDNFISCAQQDLI
jgi:hypothetical protein